jgi:hypothetical protein
MQSSEGGPVDVRPAWRWPHWFQGVDSRPLRAVNRARFRLTDQSQCRQGLR